VFDLASSCREIVAQLKSGGKRPSAPRGACAKTEKKNEHDSESASVLLAGSRREKKKKKKTLARPQLPYISSKRKKTD
jgi:hypothetical protein